MSDNGYDDLELLRQNNIKEKDNFLKSLLKDPLFADVINSINAAQDERKLKKNQVKSKSKRRRGGDDSLFRFTGAIPTTQRKSARVQNKKPDYTYLDLPSETKISKRQSDDSVDELDEVVYRVKRRKSSFTPVSARIIPVEEVTKEMIQKVQLSGIKVYGAEGTSCHQCRQKTVDTKTICRSGFCVGVRGQFCGICVINRYGEDPIKALKDPNWNCYVCRGCCNCSVCRNKEGKRPTGILAPLAKMRGFKSVKDFLSNLNGYGDYADADKDLKSLIGFDGTTAVMSGNVKIELKCNFDDLVFYKNGILTPSAKIQGFESAKVSTDLLGFDGTIAVMGGNVKIELKCDFDYLNFQKNVVL